MKRLFWLSAFLFFFVWVIFPKKHDVYGRKTIVAYTDVVTVWSWEPRDGVLTKIFFPTDMASASYQGYGTYSFDAFWQLGKIDNKDGTVLSKSVSDALGIPIDGYIDRPFSFSYIPGFFTRGYRTNMTLGKYVQFVWLLAVSKPARIQTFDFTQNTAAIAQQQTHADGSTQWVVDPHRIDVRLAHIFEDEQVRRETISVAVLNTTALPLLGSRIARLLENMGISVVSVGNSPQEITGCIVEGVEESLESASSKVIIRVLGCTKETTLEVGQSDLIVRLGANLPL